MSTLAGYLWSLRLDSSDFEKCARPRARHGHHEIVGFVALAGFALRPN